MPRTPLHRRPELAIQLSDSQRTYRPGDIINGRVVRTAPIDAPKIHVIIQLFGCAASAIESPFFGDGMTTTILREEYDFFNEKENTEHLYLGPIRIDDGDQNAVSWPFSITIPTRPSPETVAADHRQELSYLPLDRDKVAQQDLPGSFLFQSQRAFDTFQGYVAYYLTAKLQLGYQNFGGRATRSIIVRGRSTEQPIIDVAAKSVELRSEISSRRLVPGKIESRFSFAERVRRLFDVSKVSRLPFAVYAELPTVIQIGNPKPIPFRIRIMPHLDPASRDLSNKFSIAVKLVSISLQLLSHTTVQARPNIGKAVTTAHETIVSFCISQEFNTAISGLPGSLSRDTDRSGAQIDNDLGSVLQLGLESRGPTVRGKLLEDLSGERQPIKPCFTTYNIKHWHQLECQVKLDVSGRPETVAGEQVVEILGLSENQAMQERVEIGEDEMQKSDSTQKGSAGVDLETATDIVNIVGGLLLSV